MFDRGQLSAFIGLVYPHLTHVGIEPTLLEELTPAALEARLYFDYPYAEAVRGRAEFVSALNVMTRMKMRQSLTVIRPRSMLF